MPRLTKQRKAAQAREQRKKLKQIAPDLDPTTWMLMAVETEDPEPVATPTGNEVYLPEEAILSDEPPVPKPKEDDFKPVDAPEVGSCVFCSRDLPNDGSAGEVSALLEKIEFVLATSGLSKSMPCCLMCSQMFDLCCDFKQRCLQALSEQKELLREKSVEPVKPVEEAQKLFSCPICFVTFTQEDEFGYHTNKHYGIKPFRCKKGCRKAFHNPKNCFIHEVLCSAVPLKDCDQCALSFATDIELERHKIIHSKPQFSCPRCSRTFFFALDCENHERVCRSQAEDPLQGIKPEDALQTLGEDSRVDSLNASESVEKMPEPPVENLDPDVENNSVDLECLGTIQNVNLTKVHQAKCKPYVKKLKIRQCALCGKTFNSSAAFETHLNKHAGVRSYSCRKPGCSKTFFGCEARKSHEVYCGTKGYVCEVCGATLRSPTSLRTHRAKHDAPRFACQQCDKRFKTKTALKKHMPAHSVERKYECETCGKRFKSAEANRVHQSIHTGWKPYACPECGQRFAYNCLLKPHLVKCRTR
uniref:Zinc finger protein 345 n=1 Tax=Culex pipiens TaxID=7175 RepID=A0A8D8JHU9_CULPI